MKKLLLSVASVAAITGLVAQTQPTSPVKVYQPDLSNVSAIKPTYKHTGMELQQQLVQKPNKTVVAQGNKALNEDVIGTTTYDLQSNAAIAPRTINQGSGNVGATWTFSQSGDLAAADRGTGYNRGVAGVWNANPSVREEAATRTGWSNLMRLANGRECVISHKGADGLWLMHRTPAGSGAWTEVAVPNPPGQGILWPRAVSGGSNGNTIHLIAITTPTPAPLNGTIYNGFDGALLYYRSTDGGNTWDINAVTPTPVTPAEFYGFGGDSYAIDSKGDVVTIAVFSDFENSFILKSTDNGSNWTKTNFITTGFMAYNPQAANAISDVNNDLQADTIATTDNYGAVLIDNSNQVHVWYGRMRILDDDPAVDANTSYFPGTNGLDYWNESMNVNSAVTITGALDIDNSGGIDILNNDVASIAKYFASLSSMPSVGIGSNGAMFVTYSAFMENKDNGSQHYRHIYTIYSNDGGNNWSDPIDLNYGNDFEECVFGSLARNVDTKIHVVYQRDTEPGLAVRGDEDAFGSNDIVYMRADTAGISSVGVTEVSKNESKISVYPNPANDYIQVGFESTTSGNITLSISNVLGENVAVFTNTLNNTGYNNISMDVSGLQSGIYFLNINENGKVKTQKFVKQ